MSQGRVEIIFGSGCGKTALALGRGLQAMSRQQQVIVIQFLKGSQRQEDLEVVKRLEPEFKLFRFEKSDCYFDRLSAEEQQEEMGNIRNGFNYAKKVLTTGECDLLVLDEFLGLVDQNIMTYEELKNLLDLRDEVDVILTGKVLPDRMNELADQIVQVENLNIDNSEGAC